MTLTITKPGKLTPQIFACKQLYGDSMDPILGQIQLFALNFVPAQWLACDGASLPIAKNAALYSLLGTTYGGNGTDHFALPDLKGKEPAPGLHYCIAIQGIFPQRP